MNFDNLITTIRTVGMQLAELKGPPKFAVIACLIYFVFCVSTLKKEWRSNPKRGERMYRRWRESELIDVYDAFNHVSNGLWGDWKRIKLKEKQMNGFDGRIISAHGQFFEYAFRIDGCRLVVCSNYKHDSVYRF